MGLLVRTVLVGGSLLVAAGCSDLRPISLGVCGNGVVESAIGEDCDGPSPKGRTCAAPSTPHECRYVCSEPKDCPPRSFCGQDGVCRTPSATWSAAAAGTLHGAESPLDIVVADADGDGRGEIFEQDPTAVVVHYDATSADPTELSIARDDLPVIGPVADLSGDQLADAVIPAGLGYFVSLGNAGRLERATAYGGLPLPSDVTEPQALSAEVLPDVPGSEVLVLAVLHAGSLPDTPVIGYVSESGGLSFIGVLPDDPDKLAGPVRPGKLNEDPASVPCDELVLAYAGSASLDLLVPCALSGGKAVLATNATTVKVRLPKGATVGGPVELEDLDLDGHLDLVVIAARGSGYEIDVAYGRGDGTFDSVSGSDPTTSADGAAGTAVVVGSSVPLAVHDIDGDKSPDWVDAAGVYLARPVAPRLAAHDTGAPWTSALIGRFDGDALPDVVVGSNQAPGLSLYLNAGNGNLTAFAVPTRGSTTMLTSGDFDGDRILDFAAVTTTRASDADPSPDTLSIVFGAPFGAPSAPKDIGEFHRIHQLATARIASGNPPVVDGADDLGALAEDADGTLAYAVVLGQSNRDLRAPYDFTRTDLTAQTVAGYAPLRLAIGDVDGDGHSDVVSLAERVDGSSEIRLWSNPMYDQASIQQGKSTSSEPLDPSFDWEHVLFGAVNLDAQPGDEVVVLGPRADGTGYQSAVAHASTPGDAGPTYTLDPPVAVDETFTRTESSRPTSSTFNGRLRVADLDGDGASDVLALGQRDGHGELVVYFNDGIGALGAPVFVAKAATLDVRDFAIVEADGDPEPEVALLTTTGVYVVNTHGREISLGSAPSLTLVANPAGAPSLLAAGDVDGDGISDLALAGPAGVEVHRGVSTNRNDAR